MKSTVIEWEVEWLGPGLPVTTAGLPLTGRWRPRQFVVGRYPLPEPWRTGAPPKRSTGG